MATVNFKHLRYFWAVAKSGSIARASAQLHVTPQSISSQLGELREALGTELFRRLGRGLEVTEAGRRVFSYADEIFGLEHELLSVIREHGARSMLPFRVGVADSVPKSLAYRVVEPALQIDEAVRLICREGRLVSLLADLAVHRLDLVIADRPMPADLKVRAYNHLLGSSNVAVFGAEAVVRRLTGAFPEMLDGAPFLLPGDGAAIRPALELWFDAHQVSPHIIGEFDDGALLKAFGQGAAGLFVAPSAIADYVCRQYGVQRLGDIDTVVEQVYAITTERRLRHPAMVAVSQAAAREVFRSTEASGNAPGGERLIPAHEPETSSGKAVRHSTMGTPRPPRNTVSRKPNSRPALGDSRMRNHGRKPRLRRGR